MINFFKTCLFTFTIWLLAALINALLYAVIFSLGDIVHTDFPESFGASFLFSLLFSAPAAFAFWIVFLSGVSKRNLSRTLMEAALVLSLLSCVFIAVLPEEVYGGHWLLLSFIITGSGIASVMLHHRFIQSFHSENASHV